jgi:hypothetical protein
VGEATVKAVSPGKATITAKTASNNKIATCEVTVLPSLTITGVIVSKNPTVMKYYKDDEDWLPAGGELTLSYAEAPNDVIPLDTHHFTDTIATKIQGGTAGAKIDLEITAFPSDETTTLKVDLEQQTYIFRVFGAPNKPNYFQYKDAQPTADGSLSTSTIAAIWDGLTFSIQSSNPRIGVKEVLPADVTAAVVSATGNVALDWDAGTAAVPSPAAPAVPPKDGEHEYEFSTTTTITGGGQSYTTTSDTKVKLFSKILNDITLTAPAAAKFPPRDITNSGQLTELKGFIANSALVVTGNYTGFNEPIPITADNVTVTPAVAGDANEPLKVVTVTIKVPDAAPAAPAAQRSKDFTYTVATEGEIRALTIAAQPKLKYYELIDGAPANADALFDEIEFDATYAGTDRVSKLAVGDVAASGNTITYRAVAPTTGLFSAYPADATPVAYVYEFFVTAQPHVVTPTKVTITAYPLDVISVSAVVVNGGQPIVVSGAATATALVVADVVTALNASPGVKAFYADAPTTARTITIINSMLTASEFELVTSTDDPTNAGVLINGKINLTATKVKPFVIMTK